MATVSVETTDGRRRLTVVSRATVTGTFRGTPSRQGFSFVNPPKTSSRTVRGHLFCPFGWWLEMGYREVG